MLSSPSTAASGKSTPTFYSLLQSILPNKDRHRICLLPPRPTTILNPCPNPPFHFRKTDSSPLFLLQQTRPRHPSLLPLQLRLQWTKSDSTHTETEASTQPNQGESGSFFSPSVSLTHTQNEPTDPIKVNRASTSLLTCTQSRPWDLCTISKIHRTSETSHDRRPQLARSSQNR